MLRGFSRLVLVLLCIVFTVNARADTSKRAQYSILVLSADSLAYPYLAELHSSFKSTLQQELKRPIRWHAESLDLGTFDGPAYRSGVHQWYRQKYADVKLDAILVIGHAPLQFLLDYGLWADVPVYFVSASETVVKGMQLPANMTGQTVLARLVGTVHLAKKLLPATSKLALVGNVPDRDNYRPFRATELDELSREVEFIDLRGMRFENVLQRVAALPENTVIYYTTLNDDGTGRLFEPRGTLVETLRVANRPTFIDVGTSIGLGAVGGAVAHARAQGHRAALRTLKILSGAHPSTLPVEGEAMLPVFDWRQLQRWKIPDARLPADSEVRFYQPTVWQQYRVQIIGALVIMACLFALTVALLVERRLRAVAVAQSRRRLAEIAHMNRNATASVYSAAIAHELNQPLAAILSNAEAAELMLAHEPAPLAEVREILADIRRDDRRASDLITRMRNLLKQSEATSLIVDMNLVVSDALKFIASEAAMRGTEIKTAWSAIPALVLVDAVQMQQVLINLVLNSLDAMSGMPSSARIITIEVSIKDEALVEVIVTDTGSGFDSQIDQVFESFFTTKSHGMGLGLSITAAIIQAHGGAIQASNAPNGGACIRFQLPYRAA